MIGKSPIWWEVRYTNVASELVSDEKLLILYRIPCGCLLKLCTGMRIRRKKVSDLVAAPFRVRKRRAPPEAGHAPLYIVYL